MFTLCLILGSLLRSFLTCGGKLKHIGTLAGITYSCSKRIRNYALYAPRHVCLNVKRSVHQELHLILLNELNCSNIFSIRSALMDTLELTLRNVIKAMNEADFVYASARCHNDNFAMMIKDMSANSITPASLIIIDHSLCNGR